MKSYILMLCLSMLVSVLCAQTKTNATEKPPTRNEMEEMMKEMQKALNEMSPEDKKAMEEMGVQMPDLNKLQESVSGISDAQLNQAYEDENRIIPEKDLVRINAAMATTLSDGEMSAYISKTHQSVLMKLSPAVNTTGAIIYEQVQSLNKSAANAAVGLWMDGKPTLALYLMGEVCNSDPTDAINLNNYAAFLSMCGAEQLSLPILYNLNNRFPDNSTIINNIAQAWLGLGDIPKAEEFADKAIRIYAYHPQANMAKCLIEESRGNIPAAIAAAKKSISKAYSTEKADKLKKLGYDLTSDDIYWDRPMPQDALGLGKFNWPDYPMDVAQNAVLEKEWQQYKNECQQRINELQIKQESLEEAYIAASEYRQKLMISESRKGRYVQVIPGYAAKAIIKLGPGVSDVNGNMSFVFANELNPVVKAVLATEDYENTLRQKQELLNKKYEDQIGEGKSNPMEAICKDENAIRSEFLTLANGEVQSAYRSYFSYMRRRTSDLLYYYQYTMWPEQFELAKVLAQISWLTQIKDQRVNFKSESSWCVSDPGNKKSGPLQNFDDVHCDYVSTMNLGVFKITSSCSNLIGEFDFGGVVINMTSNVETGLYSGSAMVGVSEGIDGPMGTEVEGSIAGLVEWDNTGITDIGIVAGVTANAAGVNIAGVDVKATVNGGVSRGGSSILQDI